MPATPAWLAAAETLFNRGIRGSLQATLLARRLHATALRVEIEGLTSIRASVTDGRLALVADRSAESEPADATLSGSPFALLKLARMVDGGARRSGSRSAAPAPAHTAATAAAGTAAARATVRGDAEVANSYRQLLAAARPDLEEELSRLVGDLPARRLSQLAIGTLAWVRKTQRTVGENISEYLQEESRDLVNRPELEEFLHGVDALRELADRVEARVSRLEQRLKGSA